MRDGLVGFDLDVFLHDLSRVANACDASPLGQSFFDDLVVANRAAEAVARALIPKPEELIWLGQVIDELRVQHQKSLHERLAKLSPDSPLLCPVSLLGTIDYGRLETAHTRLLAWLFDPAKEHGFGDALLGGLMRWAGLWIEGRRPVNVESLAERSVRGGGRTDVWVEGGWQDDSRQDAPARWLLVIEAKVDAKLGDKQLANYDREIFEWMDRQPRSGGEPSVARIFLAPDDQEPEDTEEDWKKLDYETLAGILWRSAQPHRQAPGFMFLRYYLTTLLKDVIGLPIPLHANSNSFLAAYVMDVLETKEVSQ